jgi:hypothetical protein
MQDRTSVGPAEFRRKVTMKKIILLALAAASVAAFALPATAMAVEEDVAVHEVPAPIGAKTITGEGSATLTGSFGNVVCTSSSGTATFENSTTGTFEQTFKGCTFGGPCTTEGQAAGTITTTVLPFHLVTVEHTPTTGSPGPGVLVTPNAATGVFAHFTCGFIKVTVEGNGLLGTITKPPCGGTSSEPTIQFSSSSTSVQTHKTVVGTPNTEYSIKTNLGAASEDASGIISLGTPAELVCT